MDTQASNAIDGRRRPGADAEIAIIIPCYNEGVTIGGVVGDFRAVLPNATVYVYDNNSADDTVAQALAAGAVVGREYRQGKGNVMRRMFADVDADVYVMVDGDGTYDAKAAPEMVRTLIDNNLDLVVGTRLEAEGEALFRSGHRFGNRLLTGLVTGLFGRGFADMLSGYRVLSRRFVKSFPTTSTGFEIETELSIHALQLCLPTAEVRTRYFARPEGSASKLRTYSDGFRILMTILYLLRDIRPALFFSAIALLFIVAAVALATPIVITYYETGLVPRLPSAVLATGLVLISCLSLVCGLILDSVANGRVEQKRLAYLASQR